jgi:hypothetical protein
MPRKPSRGCSGTANSATTLVYVSPMEVRANRFASQRMSSAFMGTQSVRSTHQWLANWTHQNDGLGRAAAMKASMISPGHFGRRRMKFFFNHQSRISSAFGRPSQLHSAQPAGRPDVGRKSPAW